jgi:DNA-binding LytR/AlgR family response regulator
MEGRNKTFKEEMEMRIAICDDELNALKQTHNVVEDVFNEMQLKYFIDEYTDADEMLQNKKQYDMIFLDIELKNPGKNGVWAAKIIKRYNPDCIIIFTTNHEEYIDEVIEKYAFRYWSKPIDAYRLKNSIIPILERMQTIILELYESKRTIEIPFRNIIYITPQDKNCKVVTITGEYIIADSYKNVKGRFPTKNFCECHGSYCVNLHYVDKYTKLEVQLAYKSKKYSVHMSRRQYANFKEHMFIMGDEQV